MMLGRSLVASVLVLLAGCPRGDKVECEQACRNFASLRFPGELAAGKYPELLGRPGEDPAALKLRQDAALALKLEDGLTMCVSQCQSAGNDDQIKCMKEAKTVEAASACHEEFDESAQRR